MRFARPAAALFAALGLLSAAQAVSAPQAKRPAPGGGTAKPAPAPAPKAPQKMPEVRLSVRIQVTGNWSSTLQAFDPTTVESRTTTEKISDRMTINAEGTYRRRLTPDEYAQLRREGSIGIDAAEKPWLKLFGGGGATLERESRGTTTDGPKTIPVISTANGTATHTVQGETDGPGVSFNLTSKEFTVGLASAWSFWSPDQVKTTGVLRTKRQAEKTESGTADWQILNAQTVCLQTIAQAAVAALTGGNTTWYSDVKGKFKPLSKTLFQASGQYSFNFSPPDETEKSPNGDGYQTTTVSQQGQVRLDYTLAYDADPVDIEAVIQPPKSYDTWMPEGGDNEDKPGNKITFRVSLHDPQASAGAGGGQGPKTFHTAQFRVALLGSTSEPGVCLNHPPKAKAKYTHDFKLVDSPMLKVDPGGQTASSIPGLRDLEIPIESFDWGGYTRLAVKATLENGKTVEAYLEHQPSMPEVSIPKDVNHNKIADAWETSLRRDKEWDSDPIPSGQKTTGDSITYYEEYRGFMVLKGGQPKHVRTDPDSKEIFVIDETGFLDEDLWLAHTGIQAYELTREMVQGPSDSNRQDKIVDFNSGYAAAGHKYARTLIPSLNSGVLTDETRVFGHTENLPQNASPQQQTPVITLYVRRYEKYVRDIWIKDVLQIAALVPASDEMKLFTTAGIDHATVLKAWRRVQADPSTVDRLLKRLWTLTAIHEMGHACRLDGHLGPVDPKTMTQGEEPGGERHCIQRYFTTSENREVTIDGILGYDTSPLPNKVTHFCRSGFNCWGSFDVLDKD